MNKIGTESLSHPVMGFNIGGAKSQDPITSVCRCIGQGNRLLQLFQANNINDEWSKQINHIFNKNVANVETSLHSMDKFIHKIKSTMQEKKTENIAKSCNINKILLKQALQTGKIQVLRQPRLPTVLFYLP